MPCDLLLGQSYMLVTNMEIDFVGNLVQAIQNEFKANDDEKFISCSTPSLFRPYFQILQHFFFLRRIVSRCASLLENCVNGESWWFILPTREFLPDCAKCVLEFYFQLMSFILITSSLSIYWQIAVKCFLLLQDVRIFILSLFLDQLSP